MAQSVITVLIDAYNYGRFIDDAIRSVLDQDFSRGQLEVLVVDDGSTDDTPSRVAKYGNAVQYFRKPNGGQASAFNFGFRHARGEIIALLDADDYFLPSKLARIADVFQGNPEAGLVYHRMAELNQDSGELRDGELVPLTGFLPDDRPKLLAYRMQPTSGLAFRRSALDLLLPMPETITTQADGYIALLAPLVTPVVGLLETLSVYRIHRDNLYYSPTGELSTERRKRRAEMSGRISDGLTAWGRSHPDRLAKYEARLFLNQWSIWMRECQFQLFPPGRLRGFWFLLRRNRAYAREQTLKFTAFNYFSALSSLVFGYEEARAMHDRFKPAAQRTML